MNYELQNKLIMAGWGKHLGDKHPELLKREYYNQCSLCGDGAIGLCKGCVIRRYMNLSELIEACGELEGENRRFFLFNSVFYKSEPPKWSAGMWDYYDRADSKDIEVDGSTPEEAVANLWLKLKGKITKQE